MSTTKTRPRKMPDDWYDSWTVTELRDHQRASMHQAQVQAAQPTGDRNLQMVRLCTARARTYANEIAKRTGARP